MKRINFLQQLEHLQVDKFFFLNRNAAYTRCDNTIIFNHNREQNDNRVYLDCENSETR